MFRKVYSFAGLLLLAGAAVLVAPDLSQAQVRGGGAHFGGVGHFGGVQFGGYHGGVYRGGFSGGGAYRYPYEHYGYHNYYGGYGYGLGLSYPYYGGYYGYPYYGSYYPYSYVLPDSRVYLNYNPSYGDMPTSDPYAYLSATPQAGGYQSFYPATTAQPDTTTQGDTTAHVTVSVPAGARLWFDNTLMTTTGTVRQFDSPPLAPGSLYAYDIKASWNEDGHEVTQTQKVVVTAGLSLNVEFPVAPGSAGRASAVTPR